MTHLRCPDCAGTGKADPHLDDGPDVWTDECAGCWGSGRADELDCSGCGMCVSFICGQDPHPHACDPENPLSFLCEWCRLEPEHHHLRCLSGGVLREVA